MLNNYSLGLKMPKQLVARQPRKGVTVSGRRCQTRGKCETNQGRHQSKKADNEEAGIFYLTHSVQEERSRDNIASPWLTGAGSDLLMVKVSLTIV